MATATPMTVEVIPDRKFDPRNPRHWLLVAIFVAQVVIFVRTGGTPPTPPDLDTDLLANAVASKVVAEQASVAAGKPAK